MNTWFALFLLVTAGLAFTSAFPEKLEALEDNLEDDEYEEEPKRPYSFSWAAARHYNGDPDREHQEQRGEDGITRGVYRYVDPRDRVQEIVYYADDQGFHVQRASNLPKETAAVQKARKYHEELFEKIRQEHARIAAERALLESQEKQYQI
uniref:Cuticle protein 7 n=1 Tax=Scylla olivacea TaxID=85551 RepID=A0A0P4WHS0_SCYOL